MNIRHWQYAWAAVVLLAFCLTLLFETGILPEGICAGYDSVQYACDCLTLALTLGGIYVGMKMGRRHGIRLLCFLPLILSLMVYYLFMSATTLACAAAIGVAMVLQWPRAHTPQI